MKAATLLLAVFAACLAGSGSAQGDEQAKVQTSLSLYIVSNEKIEG